MSCSENPLCSNECAATKVLIQGVDQGHVPAPLSRGTVFTTNHSSISISSLDSTDILVCHGVFKCRSVHCGREWVVLQRVDRVVSLDDVDADVAVGVLIVVVFVGIKRVTGWRSELLKTNMVWLLFSVTVILMVQKWSHKSTNLISIYSQFSRHLTTRGSCTGLVTVCPTKV